MDTTPDTRDTIVFYLNHERIQLRGQEALMTLSDWLRYRKGLTGTKVVCSEGDCGACTVILGWLNAEKKLEYRTIDACIQFLFQLDLCHVITVESLEHNGCLHRSQQAMIENFGSQCGFCTPGIVMSLAHLAETGKTCTSHAIKEKLAGNLCRCTGYEAIVKAGLAMNNMKQKESLFARFDLPKIENEFSRIVMQSVKITAESGQVVFKPANLAEVLKLRAAVPDLKIVAGATDLGVLHNKGKLSFSHVMTIAHLHEMAGISVKDNILSIGATANWSNVMLAARDCLPAFSDILKIFAAEQIRNAATIGGNIINASPIADSIPCLIALGAQLVLQSSGNTRTVPIQKFYTGYKQFDLKPNEILTQVILPLPEPDTLFRLYKVSKRRDLDISTVTLGVYLKIHHDKVTQAVLAAGGVAATVIRLTHAETILLQNPLSEKIIAQAAQAAADEIQPLSDVRGSAAFRKKLISNLIFKFYYEAVDGVIQSA